MSLSLLLDLFCASDYRNVPLDPHDLSLDLLQTGETDDEEDKDLLDLQELSYNALRNDFFSSKLFNGNKYGYLLDSILEEEETAVDILEKEIKMVDIRELKQNYLSIKDDNARSTVTYESFTTIRKQTIQFRRVTLKNDAYSVGWVVDEDVNVCMCCGLGIYAFPLMMKKFHCRACGNIVCDECSPYQGNVSTLHEDCGSRVCHECFHNTLLKNFTQFQRYGSFDKRKGMVIDVEYLKSVKAMNTPAENVATDPAETNLNLAMAVIAQSQTTDEDSDISDDPLIPRRDQVSPLSVSVALKLFDFNHKSPKLVAYKSKENLFSKSPKAVSPSKRHAGYFLS